MEAFNDGLEDRTGIWLGREVLGLERRRLLTDEGVEGILGDFVASGLSGRGLR